MNNPDLVPILQENSSLYAPSIDPEEVERFSRIAAEWWNPTGKFAPLHKFNPTRIAYIRDQAAAHWDRDALNGRPLKDLRLLDIGCGGGLLSEPMTRLGATVVGVDAAEQNIKTAQLHAQQSNLQIDYRHTSAEALAAAGEQFDLILNMEVIEHVADRLSFIQACSHMLKPGGLMILATLNRTPKSYLLAIVGAEYILRWLPRGTHQWQKFVWPSELGHTLRQSGLQLQELTGVTYNPFNDRWTLSRDLDVNYMALAIKPQ